MAVDSLERLGSLVTSFEAALHRSGPVSYLAYLYRAHLQGFAWSNYQDCWRVWREGAPDGLPLPPMYLRYLVIGDISATRFLDTGRRQVDELILPLLERQGRRIGDFAGILDFGCGCGRILRYWRGTTKGRVAGVDVNPRLIDWCSRHLPFAGFRVCGLRPPLEFGDQTFDFIYARSVFPHLDRNLEGLWIRELRRLLMPGGILLFTVSGDRFLDVMSLEERAVYQAGELAVRNADLAGLNRCAAFHPRPYVEKTWSSAGFEILEVVPGGRIREAVQDTYLVRRPAD